MGLALWRKRINRTPNDRRLRLIFSTSVNDDIVRLIRGKPAAHGPLALAENRVAFFGSGEVASILVFFIRVFLV